VFCYLPFWFQRKFIFGVHVPLCILGAVSADWMLARIRKRPERWCVLVGAAVLLLPVVVSTQLYLLVTNRRTVQENPGGLYYIDPDTLHALEFLKHDSNLNDVVFATKATSSLIPAFSGNTVVWGHWAMSVDLRKRTQWVSDVFAGQSGWDLARRRQEFWDAGIRYIFVSGALKQLFGQRDLSWLIQGTDKVFENASVTIYRRRDTAVRTPTDLPHRAR